MITGIQHIPKRYTWIVGVDEAGRGPVAGPVSVGVVLVRRGNLEKLHRCMPGVRDSKKLSATKREEIIVQARTQEEQGYLFVQTILTPAHIIDTQGISPCITQAVEKGIEQLVEKLGINPKSVFVQLDGSLRAPLVYKQETIIKGDDKIFAIALASVYAKVTRDKVMEDYDLEYPQYNFYQHKGYGTREHIDNIKKFGLSPIHRTSFLKKYTT